ncbi:MAG: hypothetical protein MPW14_17865 [Candidatus Manganitrophus sp.]|nr:MAG: hypothetical protein MPW14_17865 [Candidatus Manganitrophus sp.]
MRLDRLTTKAQEAFQEAQKKAESSYHQQIDEVHLILALIEQKEGIVPTLLKKMGIPLEALRAKLNDRLKTIPEVRGPGSVGQVYITQSLASLVERAEKEAEQLKDEYISTEHLFWASSIRRARSTRSSPRSAYSGTRFSPPWWKSADPIGSPTPIRRKSIRRWRNILAI